MAARKLDETTNIVDLYMHHVGTSEVPARLHRWACLSLIAACVSDRVYFRKFRSSKLTPNLFTLFLADSASGKGEAVNTMMQYAKHLPILGTYAGNATAQYILKVLARKREEEDGTITTSNKMYLVCEELAMNVGTGPMAQDFIKHMTGLYKGGDYPIEKGTITGGHTTIHDHCLNLLIGTNVADAVECIPRSAIDGGFLGRVAVIHAKYNTAIRYTRPIYPPDYDEVAAHLHERFALLTQYEGEFHMSEKAARIEDHWYMNRPAPEDEAQLPTWKREHDLSLKLAMILALAEIGSEDALLMRARHVEQAQQLVVQCHKAAPLLQHAAHQNKDAQEVETVRRLITRAGSEGIMRSALQRKLSPKGILKDSLDASIGTLVTEGAITAAVNGKGGMQYTIQTRKVPPDA